MGGICIRLKRITTSNAATAAVGTQEQPNADAGAADAKTSHTPQLATATSQRLATALSGAAEPAVCAQEYQKAFSVAVTTDLDAFTLGDGCGVYLVEQKAFNGTLVTEYAKECPTEEEGLVLLQIKPPPYRPIPESRFTLQGGKRVLKQNIRATTKNAAGQAKYCAVVLDFVRLADTYKGFLWASPHLDEALQPLSLFIVGTKQRTSLPEGSAELHADDEKQQQQQQDTGGSIFSDHGKAEKDHDKGAADERETDTQKQPSRGVEDNVEKEGSISDGNEGETMYVQYLEAKASFSYRLLDRCGILPVPTEKAKEIIPPWSKVESTESLRKMVVGAGGAFFSKETMS